MKLRILFVSLLVFQAVRVESKPLKASRDSDASNEIDYGKLKKNKPIERAKEKIATSGFEREEEKEKVSRVTEVVVPKAGEEGEVSGEGSNAVTKQPYNPIPNLFVPLLQRLQFSPQTFFQDRLSGLKDSLVNLGLVLPGNNATAAKQFTATNGLLNLIGLNDSGFYTDRLEPTGFLGGNGWFANKGGILGGPGAIYSTGSILTDYPTPYKK